MAPAPTPAAGRDVSVHGRDCLAHGALEDRRQRLTGRPGSFSSFMGGHSRTRAMLDSGKATLIDHTRQRCQERSGGFRPRSVRPY